MSRKSRDLQSLVKEMEYWVKSHPDETTRHLINHWLDLAKSTEVDIDIIYEEARNMSVRNPAFPDDLVGWLDDDFDNDDDEDDEDDDEA